MKRPFVRFGLPAWLVVLSLALLSSSMAVAQQPEEDGEVTAAAVTAPGTVHYQGYVTVSGTPYNGTGYFKFAVVSSAGTATYWSNNGTSVGGAQPTAAVPLTVSKGYFNVRLGSTMTNMNKSIGASVFKAAGRYLRVWFATKAAGPYTQLSLTPIDAAPYALNADTLDGLDSSALGTSHTHWGQSWSGTGRTGLRLYSDLSGLEAYSTAWGTGVLGGSKDGYGVRGSSVTAAGVYGGSDSGAGVHGASSSGAGVVGYSSTATGVQAFSVSGNIIEGWGKSGWAFHITNSGTLWVRGNLTASGTKPAVVATRDYGQRQLYAVESAEVWFEDVGSAQLVNGQSRVSFEPIFAQTINTAQDYHVFVTPISEGPVLLSVMDKGSAGFTVKGFGLDGQPVNGEFEWRVIGKRLGYEGTRLEATQAPDAGPAKPVAPQYPVGGR